MIKRIMVILLALGLAVSVNAQEVDEDEKLEESVRNFGYISGVVLSCSKDGEKIEIERKALSYFTEVLRAFGSDSAFYYAASFGFGSVDKQSAMTCDEARAAFEQATAKKKAAGK